MKHIKYPGHFFVVSAPSGAGKTSLVSTLIQQDPSIQVSVSHTTRTKRPGETDGQHYFFVSNKTFDAMIEADAFIEHANVFGNHYGTSRNTVLDLVNSGMDVVLEIDWQGAMQIKKERPDCIMLFLLPPSKEELMSRLKKRGTDSRHEIKLRFDEALNDINQYVAFDKVFVNKDVNSTVKEITDFIKTAPNHDKSFSEEVELIIEAFRSSN